VFTIAGLGFLIAKDLSQAVIFLALSFVFDPFNIEMAFQKKPLYQRVWLIIQILLVLILFLFLLSGKVIPSY